MNVYIIGDQGGSCDDYFVLNDPTRNLKYSGDYYCDQLGYNGFPFNFDASPGWRGPAWYRMAEPAGITIPEEPVYSYHCNGRNAGWLDGHHPTTPGETINATICFDLDCDGYTSYSNRIETIQIKHCSSYYLYYLVDLAGTKHRYCSTSTTLIGNHSVQRFVYINLNFPGHLLLPIGPK